MLHNVIFHRHIDNSTTRPDTEILETKDAQWFIPILRRIPELSVEEELLQEDWGVMSFVSRRKKKIWIGLSFWLDGENQWLAHVHHDRIAAIWQRHSSAGKRALERLITDVHAVLASDPDVTSIDWYAEKELSRPDFHGHPTPLEH